MTNNEITEYLNEETNKLLPGIKVTLGEVYQGKRCYRFDYNDMVTVIEAKVVERLSKDDIVTEIVEPTVAKFKELIRRREGIGTGIFSGYGRKEIEEMAKAILGDNKEQREKEIAEETAREFAKIKESLKKETKND